MQKIYISILLIITVNICTGQNLIHNHNFYSGSFDPSISPDLNFDENISVWEGRLWEENAESRWHSPDWHDMYIFKYVKMSDYELIQQELDDPLSANKVYKITCEIYISDASANNSKLKFYISKKKMKYDAESSGSICSSNYMSHNPWYQVNQSTNVMAETNLSNYVANDFHTLEFYYLTPLNDFNGFDWFTIEAVNIQYQPGCAHGCHCVTFLEIYSVSFEETEHCNIDLCSRTDGPKNPTLSHDVYTPIDPIYVHSINNAFSLTDIRVINSGGSVVRIYPDLFDINGFDFDWYFDGKNSNGTILTQGIYTLMMEITNDCGTYHFDELFEIFTEGYSQPPDYSFGNQNIYLPLECCIYLPDIYIDDITLEDPGLIDYIANNTITVAASLPVYIDPSAEEVLFQAGQTVTLKNGFHAETGSQLEVKIETCTPQGNIPPLTLNYMPEFDITEATNVLDSTLFETEITDIETSVEDFNDEIIIYPNPCNDFVSILLPKISENIIIEVRDISGLLIKFSSYNNVNNITINVKSLTSGIYNIILYNEEGVIHKRILKM